MIKNNFPFGLAFGVLLPIIFYPILVHLDKWIVVNDIINKITGNPHIIWGGFKDSTLFLLTICTNLVPTFFANRKRLDEFVRGIMIPTVVYCFVWFFYYWNDFM
jgi:hypothetical protein